MSAFKSLLEETAQRLGKADILDPEVQAEANRELEKLARAHITFRLQRISCEAYGEIRPALEIIGRMSDEDIAVVLADALETQLQAGII